MREPAIKGSVFRGVIDDLRRLRDEGAIAPEKLEDRLTTEERDWLDSEVCPGTWYPIESYARLTDLLCEIEAGDPIPYFRGRGAKNAQRLIESGLYTQLEFLKRWERVSSAGEAVDPEAILNNYQRSLRLVITLARSIYNVGEWTSELDPDRSNRARIEIRDAAAYSENMRHAIEGFLNECVRSVRFEVKHLYTSERVAPDHIRISMTEGLADFYGVERS